MRRIISTKRKNSSAGNIKIPLLSVMETMAINLILFVSSGMVEMLVGVISFSQMSSSIQMGLNEIFLTNEIHIILFLRYLVLIILSSLRERFSWQGRCEYHRSILSHFSDIFICQMRVEMSSEDSMTASSSMARIMEDLIP